MSVFTLVYFSLKMGFSNNLLINVSSSTLLCPNKKKYANELPLCFLAKYISVQTVDFITCFTVLADN